MIWSLIYRRVPLYDCQIYFMRYEVPILIFKIERNGAQNLPQHSNDIFSTTLNLIVLRLGLFSMGTIPYISTGCLSLDQPMITDGPCGRRGRMIEVKV